ncbi:MAG: Sir2 family NAD-dependent protein deacetylase, partial [Myxococcota bacterium]
ARWALERAHHILAFLGSGFSADSGVATFRDEDRGIYADETILRMTRAQTFETEPELQLAWHQRWREQLLEAKPSPAHRALARLAARTRVTIATQNIDLLTESALREVGLTDHVEVLHLHGRLDRIRCVSCKHVWQDAGHDFIARQPCPKCGTERTRPDVVWFGEELPERELERSMEAAQVADVCLVIGTSGLVYPAASIPEIAKRSGARVLELNVAETSLTRLADVHLTGRAADVLPRVVP